MEKMRRKGCLLSFCVIIFFAQYNHLLFFKDLLVKDL